MEFVTMATSHDERDRAADTAALPVGSFEQHGAHLPLATDSLVASILAKAVSDSYSLFLLPPITVTCSHEHAGFPGTVSISATTLAAVITDIRDSLGEQGIQRLVIISGHGGNYVLSNIAQQANRIAPHVLVYPNSYDWNVARQVAGLQTSAHEDMHGGEGETSILLQYASSAVGANWQEADHEADDRPDLLTIGVRGYAKDGIIGRPSLASADKGAALIRALVAGIEPRLAQLRQPTAW